MNAIDSLRLKLAAVIAPRQLGLLSPTLTPLSPALTDNLGRLRFYYTGREVTLMPAETLSFIRAYIENDIVASVQNWKSEKVALPEAEVYQVKDKKTYKRYKALQESSRPGDRMRAKDLRSSAMEEVEGHPITKLLDNPNPVQSRSELLFALQTSLDITGNALLYLNRGLQQASPNAPILELWGLPTLGASMLGAGLMQPPEAYKTALIRDPIPASRVLHLRHYNPSPIDPSLWLWGLSRLESIRRSVLTKHVQANDAQIEAFQNRGTTKIVFPKGGNMDELTPAQIEEVNAALTKKLTGKGYKAIVANSLELGSLDVGSSLVDMDILESYGEMFNTVCAVYNVRREVFMSGKSSTYNNVAEARKSSLTDGVLPDLFRTYNKLSLTLCAAYNKNSDRFVIEPDIDCFPELQDDQKKKAEYLSMLPLTPNQLLEAFGYESSDAPGMNEPTLPSGRVSVADLAAPLPVDPNTTDPNTDPDADPNADLNPADLY